MKDKNLDLDKSRDVTLLLADSIIKDVKRWELTDESNNVVVKIFPLNYHQSHEVARETTYGTKQNPKISFYIAVLMI